MIARFVQGAYRLDLTAAPYSMGRDFIPPAVAISHNITAGTSSNRYGGGELVGTTAKNRPLAFSVRILAGGQGAVEAAVGKLTAFVSQYANGETMYFEFAPGDLPEPSWGQLGAPLRYEIVSMPVGPALTDMYTDSKLRQVGAVVNLTFEVKPYANGKKHLPAQALGGVIEDVLGGVNGQSLGLRVPEATTNKILNPAFGHATWNTGWSEAASLTETQNKDQRYVFPGATCSAQLVSAAATNNTYTVSLNVGNTNKHSFSAVVKKIDGSAVTSNDVVIYYGADQTTAFTSLGDGFYLASTDNIDGVNAGTNTGITVKNGRSIFLCFYQVEEKAYHTYPCWGEMLGCAWASTPHASTSSRTAAQAKINVSSYLGLETRSTYAGAGGIAITWVPDYASTVTGNKYLFGNTGATSINGYFNATDDKYYLSDGTNTISTAAQTFAAGDTINLLFTWDSGGLNVYVNGANAATGATYTPPAITEIFIGSDNAAANQCNGKIRAFVVYASPLTSTHAAAIDAACDGVATGVISGMPWLWTKDGDNTVDNCDDCTHDNFAVVGGVVGNINARVAVYIKMSAAFSTLLAATISNWTTPHFVNPSYTYTDIGGTVDAGSSAGEYDVESITTGNVDWASATIPYRVWRSLAGKYVLAAARLNDRGSNLKIALGITYGATGIMYPLRRSTLTNAWGMWLTDDYYLPTRAELHLDDYGLGVSATASATMRFTRTTGTADLWRDFWQLVPRPLVRIASSTAGETAFVLADGKVTSVDGSTSSAGIPVDITGDRDAFEFVPGQYNELISFIGGVTAGATITYTIVYAPLITPRWALL